MSLWKTETFSWTLAGLTDSRLAPPTHTHVRREANVKCSVAEVDPTQLRLMSSDSTAPTRRVYVHDDDNCVTLCVSVCVYFLVAVPCRFSLQFIEPTVTQTISQSDGSFSQETTKSPTQYSGTSSPVSNAVIHTVYTAVILQNYIPVPLLFLICNIFCITEQSFTVKFYIHIYFCGVADSEKTFQRWSNSQSDTAERWKHRSAISWWQQTEQVITAVINTFMIVCLSYHTSRDMDGKCCFSNCIHNLSFILFCS